MKNEIALLRNNQKREWTDQEWIEEFYRFFQGDIPEGMSLGRGDNPKLTQKKAYTIIWYLQEHFSILPDHIDQCSFCGDLFDSHKEGYYSEKTGKHYCCSCDTYLDDGHNDEI